MTEIRTLVTRLAARLEAAASTIRDLAGTGDEIPVKRVNEDVKSHRHRHTIESLKAAIGLHAQLRRRRSKSSRRTRTGIGNGPIWKAIDYVQP